MRNKGGGNWPMENAATLEIQERDFQCCLEKPKTRRLFHIFHRPVAATINLKCVTYVSEHVLPISSVHTVRRGGRDPKKMSRSTL
jgi:hypothetical protein